VSAIITQLFLRSEMLLRIMCIASSRAFVSKLGVGAEALNSTSRGKRGAPVRLGAILTLWTFWTEGSWRLSRTLRSAAAVFVQ
jgi:hypothetical protein